MTTRSATPDPSGALASFKTEFDVLAEGHPHDGDGLMIDAGGYIGTKAIALTKVYLACTMITIEPSSKNFATQQKITDSRIFDRSTLRLGRKQAWKRRCIPGRTL
ncbi:MAG: hypothetical protein ACRBM6_10415 [Geminicoccales bacterium]